MSQRHHVRVLLVLMLAVSFSSYAAFSAKAAVPEQAASIPTYQWQFLSNSQKAAVNASLLLPQLDWTRENYYQKMALDYIENGRKSSVHIRVFDVASGSPINAALVSYRQVSHDFMFTIGASPLDFRSNLSLNAREVWPLNWTWVEPRNGDFHYDDYDTLLNNSLKEIPHAQFFIKLWVVPEGGWIYKTWPPAYARFNEIMTNATAFQEFLGHVYDYVYHSVSHFKAIRYWITQMEINVPEYASNDAGKQLWTVQQAVEIDRVSARAIRDANPNATILLGTSNPNFMGENHGMYADPVDFAKMCISKGVDFDGVAIETFPYWTPSDYYDYIGKLTALGKSVFIHEIEGFAAVPPGGDWLLRGRWGMFSEDSQATWLKYMFTIAYGEPGVIGIQWLWYQDSQSYEAGPVIPNGLVRLDGTPRKAYYTFTDLTKQFTTSGNGTTDANGILTFRGFAGDYTVNVEGYQPFTIHVSEHLNNTFVLKLTSMTLPDQASQLLMKVGSDERDVFVLYKREFFVIYKSPNARNLLNQSYSEYQAAQQLYDSKDYAGALQHAQKALDLFNQAGLVENQYQQQQSTATANRTVAANRTTTAPTPPAIENPALISAGALGIAILLAAIILRRRKSISQKRQPAASVPISGSSGTA